jgi:hypothetical protein
MGTFFGGPGHREKNSQTPGGTLWAAFGEFRRWDPAGGTEIAGDEMELGLEFRELTQAYLCPHDGHLELPDGRSGFGAG